MGVVADDIRPADLWLALLWGMVATAVLRWIVAAEWMALPPDTLALLLLLLLLLPMLLLLLLPLLLLWRMLLLPLLSR